MVLHSCTHLQHSYQHQHRYECCYLDHDKVYLGGTVVYIKNFLFQYAFEEYYSEYLCLWVGVGECESLLVSVDELSLLVELDIVYLFHSF